MQHDAPGLDARSMIETYVRAKDGNRPHLMPHAFAEDATLQMTVKSEAIAFPARSEGLAAITDVLVRRFGQTYENIYTFCLAGSHPARDATHYHCDWLVGMTAKLDALVRVGCGSYRWAFADTERGRRIQSLDIVIETMETLPAQAMGPLFDDWLAQLPYSWCEPAQACERMPAFAQLAAIRTYLATRAETIREA